MADSDIPMYETELYRVYDEVDVVKTSSDETKTEEGKCDPCAGHKVNKVMVLAVVGLLCIVAALIAALVIVVTQLGGTAEPRFGEATTTLAQSSETALPRFGEGTATPESEIMTCPANMVYGNCSECIATCADPSGTEDCSSHCTDSPETCICPVDHLMDGTDCVPKEQCGCFEQEYVRGVIAEGTTQVSPDCSDECTCTSGTLTCTTTTCAQEAECKVVGDVRDCFCDAGYEGDGRTCVDKTIQDCYDISQRSSGNATSGDYTISPPGWTGGPFIVSCNMTIDGGGWTVIQRHYLSASRLDFNRDWTAYRDGFGTPSQELWIGNEKLFHLTNQREYELRIDMVALHDHNSYHAKYDFFRISGESDKYRLSGLGEFSGTTGSDQARAVGRSAQFNIHNMYFSTPDRDNDGGERLDCADMYYGGWWFNQCHCFNPNNGNAHPSSAPGYWSSIGSGLGNLVYTEMKVRPRVAT